MKQTIRHVLAIDPSIVSCGYALLLGEEIILSGAIRPPRQELIPTCRFIASHFHAWIARYCSRLSPFVVIEVPQYYDSLRGRVSAGRGDTLNLAFLCGYVCSNLHPRAYHVHCVTAPEWKGQVPKDVTQRRLTAAGYTFSNHDEADAIALGLWYLKHQAQQAS